MIDLEFLFKMSDKILGYMRKHPNEPFTTCELSDSIIGCETDTIRELCRFLSVIGGLKSKELNVADCGKITVYWMEVKTQPKLEQS